MTATFIPTAAPDYPSEKQVLDRLRAGFIGEVRTWEPLSRHTTWRVGGPAAIFASALNQEDLLLFLSACSEEDLPFLILGSGSNLLVTDEPLHMAVIRLSGQFLSAKVSAKASSEVAVDCHSERSEESHDSRGPSFCPPGTARITAGAGVKLPRLARLALDHSLTGLEFCAQIPGTLGAGIKINAGAFGQSLGETVEDVRIIQPSEGRWTARTFAPTFSYRSSSLPPEAMVLGASLLLAVAPKEVIAEKMKGQRKARLESQPAGSSAGSVFRNPPGQFAGSLIEEAGCKGWRRGAAVVSSLHANFILNEGGASANDIYRLLADVRREVYRAHGVKLGLEVRLVGLADPD